MRHHLSLIVQASSVSWSGGKDLCMNLLEGLPVLPPAALPTLAPSVVVIASRAYEAEIRAQAQAMAHWPMKTVALFDLMETT